MALINRDFFTTELHIPNLEHEHGPGDLLDRFIDKYEPMFLAAVLGQPLATAFKAGIEAAEPEQIWKDLRDGVVYTDLVGGNVFWHGLANSETLHSPIANYVYYWFMRNEFTQTTGIGEVKAQGENSVSVSPGAKMVQAWNEMAREVSRLHYFLNQKKADYPSWGGVNFFAARNLRPINEFNI